MGRGRGRRWGRAMGEDVQVRAGSCTQTAELLFQANKTRVVVGKVDLIEQAKPSAVSFARDGGDGAEARMDVED